jgi:purine-cytosine permease-like protein
MNGKYAAMVVAVIGTICAILFPMDNITDFLYLIGSVFVPMVAVQITDYFILKRDCGESRLDKVNGVIWLVGFIFYRFLMTIDIPVGCTLPDMLMTGLLCIIVRKVFNKKVC